MKNTQQGSTTALIISVIVVVIIAIIVFSTKTSAPSPVSPTLTNTDASASGTTTLPVVTPSQPSKPVVIPKPTPKPTPAPAAVVPTITAISPVSGITGTTVTLTGVGFTATGNTVLFGGGPVINTAVTESGTKLTFTVPSSVGADCKPTEPCPMYARLITNGLYTVAVRNANGTSNVLSFTVTGGAATGFQP